MPDDGQDKKTSNPEYYIPSSPIKVAARSKARNVFARSNTAIMGSNLTRDMYVCLRLCCPVQVAALRRAHPPSKESYRLSIRLKNEAKRSVSQIPSAPEGAT
jgi:hypothetical protein